MLTRIYSIMVVETNIIADVTENKKKNLKIGFMCLICEISDDGEFSIHLNATMDHFDKNSKFDNVSAITILYLFSKIVVIKYI